MTDYYDALSDDASERLKRFDFWQNEANFCQKNQSRFVVMVVNCG
jgi:hypothetical protein